MLSTYCNHIGILSVGLKNLNVLNWKEGGGVYFDNRISISGTIIFEKEMNSEKQLIKVTDLLGREINTKCKDIVLFYLYDDGTVEKHNKL